MPEKTNDGVIFDRPAEEEWGNSPFSASTEPKGEQSGRKSVGVVVVKDGKYLVGTRISPTGHGQICGPGGHVEQGESPAYAAVRETDEEFGIVPNELFFIDKSEPEQDSGLENYLFLCTDYEGEPQCDNEEMVGAHFLSDEEVERLSEFAFPAFINGVERLKRALVEQEPDAGAADEQSTITPQFRAGVGTSI